MADIRAQVILRATSGVSEDFVSNTFAFRGTAPASDTTQITAAIKGFYDAINATLLPATVAQNNHIIKYTNLPGTPPNYPFLETTFNLAVAPTGADLPSEVALVMSFQGSKAAGFPQARRRGRVFVGPLEVGVNVSGRPSGASITALTGAGAAFKAAILAIASDTQWAVWSPSSGVSVEVTDGWVDNSFDTQRRRGLRNNSRTTFS